MAFPTASSRSKNWGTEVLTDADLEAQLDLLHTYFNDSLHATTGHAHTGGTNDGPKITLTTGVQGTLPVTNGGTGQSTLTAFLNLIYPVGSLYFNCAVATNPGTLLGFGTWVAYAAGKMIIGLDAGGDTDFDALTDTGGSKTVTLTTTELPAHTHTINVNQGVGGGSNSTVWNNQAATQTADVTSDSTGSGAAFSIMNPYVVCYVWKRTV